LHEKSSTWPGFDKLSLSGSFCAMRGLAGFDKPDTLAY